MPATLASLVSDVITITKRPDLATDTVLHVKNALLKAHSSDYYLKDIFETNFQFYTPATNYSLDYKALFPRFRSIKYLETIDPISLDVIRTLDAIPLEMNLDGYGYRKDNVYYLAGSNLQIRTSSQSLVFGIGMYLYPDTTLTTPSWIADEFPFAILYEAARTLFKLIGYDEQSASSERLLAEAMAELKLTGITTQGY